MSNTPANNASGPVLCLDTTTNRLMLGVGMEDKLLDEQIMACESHRYHSALLIPAIRDLLTNNNLNIRDIQALAVNLGPGSFTGIRTGIITARTMAQFLNLPVHGFNSFELMAALQPQQPIAIYLDALRGRSYHATLELKADGIHYHREAGLIELAGDKDSAIPGVASLPLISPGLAPFFAGETYHIIADAFSSPAAMMALLGRYGNTFAMPWQEVRPFYLQEPSITLKKKPAIQ